MWLSGLCIGIEIARPWVRCPVGAGQGSVFLSLRVNSCADLFVPDLPFLCMARIQIGVHVKDPQEEEEEEERKKSNKKNTHTHAHNERVIKE